MDLDDDSLIIRGTKLPSTLGFLCHLLGRLFPTVLFGLSLLATIAAAIPVPVMVPATLLMASLVAGVAGLSSCLLVLHDLPQELLLFIALQQPGGNFFIVNFNLTGGRQKEVL